VGESRGGEGSGSEATTTTVTRKLLQSLRKEGTEVDAIRVQYVTTDLYAVEVRERGASESETYFLKL
jgi:hypothetical protein